MSGFYVALRCRPLSFQAALLPVLFGSLIFVGGCDAAEKPRTSSQATTLELSPSQGTSAEKPLRGWKLPDPLREVSGLAVDDGGLVYAVGDEQAQVFVLDSRSGATVSVFGLGKPVVKGDFEGVALHANRLYLITSEGTLLRTAPQHSLGTSPGNQHDGATLSFDAIKLHTGCLEIEGLAAAPDKAWLWILCKEIKPAVMAASRTVSGTSQGPFIRLEAWSIDTEQLLPEATLMLSAQNTLTHTGQKKFKPSGLTFVKTRGESATLAESWDLLIVSGAQRAYSRFRWSGRSNQELRLVGAGRLHARHRQAEGIEVGPEGTLLVADEGAGKRARLRVYPGEALQ